MSNVIRCEVKPHRESCRDSCRSKSVPPHSGQASWGTGRSGDVTATTRAARPRGAPDITPAEFSVIINDDGATMEFDTGVRTDGPRTGHADSLCS